MSHRIFVCPSRVHLSLVLDRVNVVPSIQSRTDLFIGLNEPLELDVQISILALESATVRVESINLRFDVVVALDQVAIVEAKVVLLLAGSSKLIIGSSEHILPLKDLSVQIAVTCIFGLGLSGKVLLVGELAIKVSLKRMDLSVQSSMVVLGAGKLSVSRVKCLAGTSELELLGVGEFSKLIRPLLGLEKIVVDCLDASIVVSALTLLHGNAISHSIDFVLVLGFLFTQSAELEAQVVGVFAHRVALVSLDAAFAAKGNALSLTAADLVADGTDLSLQLVVATVFLVQEEA